MGREGGSCRKAIFQMGKWKRRRDRCVLRLHPHTGEEAEGEPEAPLPLPLPPPPPITGIWRPPKEFSGGGRGTKTGFAEKILLFILTM